MSLQSIIQQIKTATLPGENTALRVGSALEQMDSAKRNISDSLSTSETIDMLNTVKLLAATGTPFLGTIDPTTVIPAGNFWAFASEGTYANAGGIVVGTGEIAIITRVGTVFDSVILDVPVKSINTISKTGTVGLVDTYTITYTDGSTPTTFEVKNGSTASPNLRLWSALPFSKDEQVVKDSVIYIALENVLATDVPGVSAKWKSLGSDDEDVRRSLKWFLEQQSGGTEVLDLNLNINPYPPTVYGSTVGAGLLTVANGITPHSESGFTFRTVRNMNVKAAGIKIIKLKIKPYGNDNPPAHANLLGVKNGVVTPLVVYNGTPNDVLKDYTVDVSEYDTISLSTYIQNSVPETLNQTVRFYKIESGVSIEDSVKSYIDENLGGKNGEAYIDLINFGCKGDGKYVTSNGVTTIQGTNDTIKFQQAVNALIEMGGGILYGGTNIFLVDQITIPPTLKWAKVEIVGAGVPVSRFGTVGINNIKRPTGSMMIVSNLQTQNIGVIDCGTNSDPNGYPPFNFVALVMRNVTVRTYDNPKCFGINAINALSIYLENVVVDTGVYNVQATQPSYISVGILTPAVNNAAFNYLRNVTVTGYNIGIQCEEHTDGDQIVVAGCIHALKMRMGPHAMYFKRVNVMRNKYGITVDGNCFFTIEQLNNEYVGTGQFDSASAWQKNVAEINDPSNLGHGSITWNNVRGAVGSVPYIKIIGGSNLIIKKMGSENRLIAPGNPDPNPIN